MSRILVSKNDIQVADKNDYSHAFNIMKEIMGLDLNENIWDWLSSSCKHKKPIITVVKESDEILATMAYHPRLIKTGPGRFESSSIFGQLCAPKKSGSMRKRGVSIDLMVWTENHAKNAKIDILLGLIGDELYQKYHRKYFGYSRLKMPSVEYNLYDTESLISKMGEKVNSLQLYYCDSITIKVKDCLDQIFFFKCDKNGISLINNDKNVKYSICIEGIVSPFFRFFTENNGKKNFLQFLLLGKLRIKGVFFHPLKFYNVYKYFNKIRCSLC